MLSLALLDFFIYLFIYLCDDYLSSVRHFSKSQSLLFVNYFAALVILIEKLDLQGCETNFQNFARFNCSRQHIALKQCCECLCN